MTWYDPFTGAGSIFHLDLFHPAFLTMRPQLGPPLRPFGEPMCPKQKNSLIVRAAGRQLDLLRGEASRIAKGNNVDWWIDRAEVGARFCFEDAKAKESFALACDNFGISCQDG